MKRHFYILFSYSGSHNGRGALTVSTSQGHFNLYETFKNIEAEVFKKYPDFRGGFLLESWVEINSEDIKDFLYE